jgi:hypothetical protein
LGLPGFKRINNKGTVFDVIILVANTLNEMQRSQRHMSRNRENRQQNFQEKSGIVKFILILLLRIKSA